MFEKEVKKWVKEHTEIEYKASYGEFPKEPSAIKSFKAGAEFGYNKANEWHYVKDKFPPENVPLNIITLDKNKKRRLWVGEYKGGNGEYWSGYFNHFIDVPYAWKEIVLPELKEGK